MDSYTITHSEYGDFKITDEIRRHCEENLKLGKPYTRSEFEIIRHWEDGECDFARLRATQAKIFLEGKLDDQ